MHTHMHVHAHSHMHTAHTRTHIHRDRHHFWCLLSENNQITKWKVGADSNNMSALGCRLKTIFVTMNYQLSQLETFKENVRDLDQ